MVNNEGRNTMAVGISPSVITFERDLSLYAPALATTIVGAVGLAERGPVNVPTLCTNMAQWITTFGRPKDEYPYLGLAADQYFKWGRQLQTVRIVPQDAKTARYQLATVFCDEPEPFDGIDPDNYLMKFVAGDKTIIAKLEYMRSVTADAVLRYPVIINSDNEVMHFKFVSTKVSDTVADVECYFVVARGVYYNGPALAASMNKGFLKAYKANPRLYLTVPADPTSEIDLANTTLVTSISPEASGKMAATMSGGKVMLRSKYDFGYLTNNANGMSLGFAQRMFIYTGSGATFVIPPGESRRLTFTLPIIMGGYKNYIEIAAGALPLEYTPSQLVAEINTQLANNVRKANGNRSYGAYGLITAKLVDETNVEDSLRASTDFAFSIKLTCITSAQISSDVQESSFLNPSEGSYLVWSADVLTNYAKTFTAQEICDLINAAAPNGEVLASTYSMGGGKAIKLQSPEDLEIDYISNHCYDAIGLSPDSGTWTPGSRRFAKAEPQHIYGNSAIFGSKEVFTISEGLDTMIVRIGEDIDDERDGYNTFSRGWDLADDTAWSDDSDRTNIENFYSFYRIKFPATAYGTYTVGKICKVLNDALALDPTTDVSNWEKLTIVRKYQTTNPTQYLSGYPYPRWIRSEKSKPPVQFFPYGGRVVVVDEALDPHNQYYNNVVDVKMGQAVKFINPTSATYLANTAWNVDSSDNISGVLGYQVSNEVTTEDKAHYQTPTKNDAFIVGDGGLLLNASENENPVFDDILAKNQGEWGSGLRAIVSYDAFSGCSLRIEEYNSATEEYDQVERYDNVVFDETLKDQGHIYVGDIRSNYADFDLLPASPYSATKEWPVPGIYRLAGGSDGSTSSDLTQEVNGSPEIVSETGWETGVYCFSDPEKIDLNTIIIPFYSAVAWEVGFTADTICKSRGDCMFIWDCPQGMSRADVLDWHNGEYEGGPTTALNTSYSALYWPWIQVYDQYNGKKRWCPPSGFIAGQFAYSDTVAECWYAVAGLNRGHIDIAIDTEVVPSLGDRDALQGPGSNVNPVVDFRRYGITIWGQKTLQRLPTALDRISTRRLLLYLRKVIATVSMYFVFEPNDKITWEMWKSVVIPVLADVTKRRGLEGYRVVMDESTVTDEDKNNYRMPGKIFLVPVKPAEIIPITFVINRSGQLGVDFEG